MKQETFYSSVFEGKKLSAYYIQESENPWEKLLERDFLKAVLECYDKNSKIETEIFIYQSSVVFDTTILPQKEKFRLLVFLNETQKIYLPEEFLNAFDLVYKTYLNEPDGHRKVKAFPLGLPNHIFNANIIPQAGEKSVYFLGNLNYSRLEFFSNLFLPLAFIRIILKRLYKKTFWRAQFVIWLNRVYKRVFPKGSVQFYNGFLKGGLSGQEYMNQLSEYQIILCPPGFHSNETFRHYEALAAGCIVVSLPLPDAYFYKNNPGIITIKHIKDGLNKIKVLLTDEEQLYQLKQSARQEFLENMTPEAVSSYMIKSYNRFNY